MIWEPVKVCNAGIASGDALEAARGSVMLFMGEATLFSTVSGTAGDDSLRENCEASGELKLKNPRTSVGAGAFDWAEILNQPATAPGLISPRTTRPTRPSATPDTRTTLRRTNRPDCGVRKAATADIDR